MMLQHKISKIAENRLHSAPLPQGCAPYTSSDHFRLPSTASKPKAQCWSHLLSDEGVERFAPMLKSLAKVLNPVSMMSLSIARPAPEYFPWSSITTKGVDMASRESQEDQSSIWMSCTRGEDAFDLDVALNYGYAAGSPQVLRFITEHVEMIHNPQYDDWECALTCGTTSALDIAFRLFCNRGDWVLTEGHTYSGTVDLVKAQGLNVVGVKMDHLGLVPEDLDFQLQTWDHSRGKRPHVLYIIPTGQNPTGYSQSTERRKAIYEVAERHDLFIFEDDPYFYLQLREPIAELSVTKTAEELCNDYIGRLPTSYASLDRTGRVLRMDTTSKFIAPGLRCGWITGCSQVIDKFLAYTETSTISPCGVSQVMLYKLLDQTWGHEGFIRWLDRLSSQYRQRLNILDRACHRHLPQEVCRWTKPTEGMFLWVELDWRKHPKALENEEGTGIGSFCLDIEDRIYVEAQRNGVLVSKGSWFAADDKQPIGIRYRLTFAAAPLNIIEQAVVKFAEAVRLEFDTTGLLDTKAATLMCSVTEISEPQPMTP